MEGTWCEDKLPMAGNWSKCKTSDNHSRFSEDYCHSNAALNYISQLLMDGEYLDDHKCMFVESSSYKAMETELAGLLENSSSSGCETASFGVLEQITNEDEMEQQDILSSQEMQENEIGTLLIEPQVERSEESLLPGNIKSHNSTRSNYLYKNNTDQQDDLLGNSQRAKIIEPVWHQSDEISVKDSVNISTALSSKSEVVRSSDGSPHAESEWEGKVPGDISKRVHCFSRPAAKAQPKAVDSNDPASADLIPMLVECAQAVSSNDVKKAGKLINDIRRRSTPFGSWKQRLAHYFVEALAAKLSGNGARLYTSLTKYGPSVSEMLKAIRVFLDTTPFNTIPHFYANEMILRACEGESRLHIVDFGILYGIQWSGLIQALANRQGGPPRLRITGIDFPQPGFKPAGRVEETGRRLADFARLWGVPFQYDALAIKWENIQPASLHLRHDDEVLVVNCMFRLRHLMDETMMAESPRKIVLKKIRSMNPKIFLQGIVNTQNNSPLGFVRRFHECFANYLTVFEALDACIPRDSSERLLMEQIVFGRAILNVLACEGLERVERSEPYPRWQALTQRAGFKILPLPTSTYNRARDLLKMYHRDFVVDERGGWLLLGWKGQYTHGVSAWRI
ncbi:hypothetical protein O6H91_15G090300 [Diphasiastrum complanatum]|uniref:Uncharacterized protein n=1 Tax=Diphasiastrum complanatum TaxID=34168 RepID=A0ACC2BLM7_DIPCM|nr:hypothetical protein O6H91_15G090300 [Diphasiastrum complanatum]